MPFQLLSECLATGQHAWPACKKGFGMGLISRKVDEFLYIFPESILSGTVAGLFTPTAS
jgi:hypothetical protein